MSAADIRRETRQLIKATSAGFTGRERGRDRKVRRLSYDVADRHAQVFTRVADGTRAGGLGWVDDLVRLAEEYDLQYRKPGERGPLQPSGVRVLKVLCTRFLRFGSGQLDPAIRTICLATGFTYKTVHSALTRLKAHGFLDWVRRSRVREDVVEGEAGPQREQVSNAYHFPMSGLAKAVLQRWKDLRERRRRRQQAAPVTATPDASAAATAPERRLPACPEMRAALLAIEAGLEGANPITGEYTQSGVQG